MFKTLKNIAIVIDFVISLIGFAIQSSNFNLASKFFTIGAIALFVAFLCVLIELFTKKK